MSKLKEIVILLTLITTTLSFSNDNYSVDQTIKGYDKTNSGNIVELKKSDNSIDFEKEFEFESIEEDIIIDEFEENEEEDIIPNVIILEGKEKIIEIERSKSDSIGNYIILGAGYLKRADAFNYTINLEDTIEKREIDYTLKLERKVNGEFRVNSNRSYDSLYSKINSGDLELEIEYQLKENELAFIEKSAVPTGSREWKNKSLFLDYKLSEDFSVGIKWEKLESESIDSVNLRNYELFNSIIFAKYEERLNIKKTLNQFNGRVEFKQDKLSSESVNGVEFRIINKTTFTEFEGLKLKMDLSSEYVNYGKKNETHVDLGFNISHSLFQKLKFGAEFSYGNMRKTTSEILNEFKYDDDIIAYKEDNDGINSLKNPELFKSSIFGEYKGKYFYIEGELKNNSSKNYIYYYEDCNKTYLNETVIRVGNYNEDLSWLELYLKANTTFKGFVLEVENRYRDLLELSFIPKNELSVSLLNKYKKNNFKLRALIQSDMYGELKQKAKLNSYGVINLENRYEISDFISLTGKVDNIFDENAKSKTGYKIDSRKYSFEFKIYY